jgi:glycosyltransferase involved in cell wall biosynthesis
MVKRIGWLQQDVGIQGGAEMSCNTLVQNAPEWAEVVYCPPNKRPPDDIDAYVIQNCVTYGERWIEELVRRPVVRHIRDPWYAGSPILRRWLLDNAALLIFSSPVQLEAFGYEHDRPVKIIPPPVDLDPFKATCKLPEERQGSIFVGRVDIYKGAPRAIDWALQTGEPLALIGEVMMPFGQLPPFIRLLGKVPYEQMPDILGQAQRLVFFPEWPEAFGRAVVEAWAAGCELLLDGRIGAQWWIENQPGRLGLEGPVSEFWAAVEGVIK